MHALGDATMRIIQEKSIFVKQLKNDESTGYKYMPEFCSGT
jgi:hypothetical protein